MSFPSRFFDHSGETAGGGGHFAKTVTDGVRGEGREVTLAFERDIAPVANLGERVGDGNKINTHREGEGVAVAVEIVVMHMERVKVMAERFDHRDGCGRKPTHLGVTEIKAGHKVRIVYGLDMTEKIVMV